MNLIKAYANNQFSPEGTAVNKKLFEFLAKETKFEWALSLNPPIEGDLAENMGFLDTLYEHHQVHTAIVCKTGYKEFYHNHGDYYANIDDRTFVEIVGYPSEGDIERLRDTRNIGYSNFYIYNESKRDSGACYRQYNERTMTQQELAKRYGYDVEY